MTPLIRATLQGRQVELLEAASWRRRSVWLPRRHTGDAVLMTLRVPV
jgi:hypothetical protein